MKWLVDIVFFTICLVALAVIAVLTFRVKRDETIEKKDDTDLFENRDRNDLFAHSLRAYIRGLQNCDDALAFSGEEDGAPKGVSDEEKRFRSDGIHCSPHPPFCKAKRSPFPSGEGLRIDRKEHECKKLLGKSRICEGS